LKLICFTNFSGSFWIAFSALELGEESTYWELALFLLFLLFMFFLFLVIRVLD